MYAAAALSYSAARRAERSASPFRSTRHRRMYPVAARVATETRLRSRLSPSSPIAPSSPAAYSTLGFPVASFVRLCSLWIHRARTLASIAIASSSGPRSRGFLSLAARFVLHSRHGNKKGMSKTMRRAARVNVGARRAIARCARPCSMTHVTLPHFLGLIPLAAGIFLPCTLPEKKEVRPKDKKATP